MCGFLGYIGSDHVSDAAFKSALDLSNHRGPDHQSIFRSGNDLFGFNRLAIQDLSPLGNQPMVSEDGSRVLLFNGEVYNHMELRKEFGIDMCKGHGDTETIFHMCRLYGFEETIGRLDGMFAICWMDYEQGSVSLARDMAGIKPLYYHAGKSLIFGSQLNQILSLPSDAPYALSRENMVDYFALGYMVAPDTIYSNIKQVRPGESISFSLHPMVQKKSGPYYTYARAGEHEAENFTTVLGSLIDKSVKEELVSDVPVATFMSGGIDSPVINAYAKKNKDDIRAFSFKNKYEETLDESMTANELSKIIGLDYTNVSYDNADVPGIIDDHFAFMGEPNGDFSTIPTYILCKEAKASATVIMSGDGGDELFYGYNRHLAFLRYGYLFSLPVWLRKLAGDLISRITGIKVSNPIRYIADAGEAYRDTQVSMNRAEVKMILGTDRFSTACDEVFSAGGSPPSKRISDIITRADFYGYLQRVLRKVDMMSMASSVEVRVPYLCRDIINLSRTYNPVMKDSRDLKRPLKEIFREQFPGGETFRRKIGFTIPMGKLLKGPLQADVIKYTIEMPFYGEAFIDRKNLTGYINDYFNGRHHNHQGVWHVYAWQKWAYSNKLIC